MDGVGGSPVEVVGGLLGLALLFVLRELASGALREAGEELWAWGRRKGKEGRRDGEREGRP